MHNPDDKPINCLRILKYETIAWLVIGVVHDENIMSSQNNIAKESLSLQNQIVRLVSILSHKRSHHA